MGIDQERLLSLDLPVVERTFTERDTMLYALSVGFGFDPTDEQQLPFVYEKLLKSSPTMAVVLGYVRIVDLPLGIDYTKAVHGDQSVHLHAALPVRGTIRSKTKVAQVVDLGATKGAMIYLERAVT